MKIGIDFGSTYSTVSKYDEILNHVTAITFSEGEPASIPSVVSVSKKGQITCGKGAKDQAGKKTVRIFEAFKMLLTETNQEMLRRRGYDEEYTPRRITKLFLESVLDGVLRRENDKGFEDLVICVPEIWSSKVATLDGRLILRDILINDIDIPVEHVQIVTEPEAASAFFAYNYEKQTGRNFNGHLLLIDYGGGTLDITLTKVTSDQQGIMEIRYVDGGGAGENHPDQSGGGTIGSAGIAYMQSVVTHALQDAGVVGQGESPDYTAPDFIAAVRDLESQLKSAERIRDIEDTFGAYGSYRKISRIFREEAIDFITLEYDEEEVPVTFQHLFLAYQETIEQVLSEEIRKINEKVQKCIGKDPCEPGRESRTISKLLWWAVLAPSSWSSSRWRRFTAWMQMPTLICARRISRRKKGSRPFHWERRFWRPARWCCKRPPAIPSAYLPAAATAVRRNSIMPSNIIR